MEYGKRRDRIRAYLEEKGLDGVLFTSYENRRYFCGFTGSLGYLLITKKEARMVVDMRYTTQAQMQTQGVEIIEYRRDRLGTVARMVRESGVRSVDYRDTEHYRITRQFINDPERMLNYLFAED